MADFRNFYRFEDFTAFHQALQAYRERAGNDTSSPDWKRRSSEYFSVQRRCESALIEFLQAKARAGELAPVPFGEGRGIEWVDAWNRMVADDGEAPNRLLTYGMASTMLMSGGLHQEGTTAEARLRQDYEWLIERVHDGANLLPASSHGTCRVTGEALYVDMRPGWQPVLGTLDDQLKFEPVTSGPAPLTVRHHKVDVPSGELLVCDGFDIVAFTQAMEPAELQAPRHTDSARWAISDHCAALGWACVFVNDDSLTVVERDGQLLLARPAVDEDTGDEAEIEGESQSFMFTESRRVHLIDRDVLVGVVARTEGQEDAQRQVAQALQQMQGVITTVQLPPGSKLHVYQVDHRGLQNRFRCPDVDDAQMEPLYAVASNTPLDWQPAVQRKLAPARP